MTTLSEELDIIRLTGLSAVGNHGVFDFERRSGQVFSVDLVIYLDVAKAAKTDDVVDTAHYGEIAEDAVKIIQGEPVSLIETLAEKIARMVLEYPHVAKVEATVHKPEAPVHHHFSDVAVTVVRTHADYPDEAEDQPSERSEDEPTAETDAVPAVETLVEEPIGQPDPVILDDDWAADDAAPVQIAVPKPAPPKPQPRVSKPAPSRPKPPPRPRRRSQTSALNVAVDGSFKPKRSSELPYPSRAARHRTPQAKRPAPTSHEYQVVLALGANKGDPVENLRGAIAALESNPRFEVSEVSPLVRTEAVLLPGSLPQPDYYNAVILGRTDMTPPVLLEAVQGIEQDFGRDRRVKWSARTLDIDIIAIDNMQFKTRRLTVPHSEAHKRAFVLYPWLLVDEDARVPGFGSASALLEETGDLTGLKGVQASWLEEGAKTREHPLRLGTKVADEPKLPPVEEEVVIRGSGIGLRKTEEDPLFRNLLAKEQLAREQLEKEKRAQERLAKEREAEAQRAKERLAKEQMAKEMRANEPPTRDRVEAAPPPPPAAPLEDASMPITVEVPQIKVPDVDAPSVELEQASRERPRATLPAWNFAGGNVRIVETPDEEKMANRNAKPLPRLNRGKTVRPTPTGSVPIQKLGPQAGTPE